MMTIQIRILMALVALLLTNFSMAQTAHTQTFDTRFGQLEFEYGYPSLESAEKLFDEMDFQRATQAYLWAFPAVSFQSINVGLARDLGAKPYDVAIADKFLDSRGYWLTGNTTTIYGALIIDLSLDGPVVIEVPPGPSAGMVCDFWQRSETMIGVPGRDKGQGGKYLLVPPEYKGELPEEGYFIVPTTMNSLNMMTRGIVQGDDIQGAVDIIKKTRVYPYSQRENPKPNRFLSVSDSPVNTIEPKGLEFWKRLSDVINNNPVHERDRFFMAMLKPLGIEKGKPFEPDERQKKILVEAARVGWAMAAANTFEARLEGAIFYPGTHWSEAVLAEPDQEAENYSQLDERLHWFFAATYMNPSMKLLEAGPGSVYVQTFKDKNDNWLGGDNTYRLRVPPNAPAKDFWSITVYDAETRSLIQSPDNKSALTSYDNLKVNDDGSIDLYFGPKAPDGWESNLIQTLPGKGFYVWLRLYWPTEPYFDKSWRLADVEKVN